jgi:sialic acid synthase SpsE
MFGPDAIASIEIDDVSRLVEGVKQIRSSLNTNSSKDEHAETKGELKTMF